MNVETINLEKKETSSGETFSNLTPKIHNLVLDFTTGGMSLSKFLESLEGVPGRDNFYKRLRAGTKVKVLRSSGIVDNEGWIINSSLSKKELELSEGMVSVHNKEKHIEKLIPLNTLISWNIEL